jgi:hypothetical protein
VYISDEARRGGSVVQQSRDEAPALSLQRVERQGQGTLESSKVFLKGGLANPCQILISSVS